MSVNVIGLRFREAAKIYYFAPPDFPLHVGEYVIVPTARGDEMARVVLLPDENAGDVPRDVKPITRLAAQADRDLAAAHKQRAAAMVHRMRELVQAYNLDMYVIAFQINLEGTEATGFFQSDAHADFRDPLNDLEEEFSVRVHMQHAGPRDRAKLVDGYDICGLRLCCTTWMTNFPKVGIRMAKEQDLALNPDKISGVCGRLFCCLTFEFDVYREMRGTLPKVGKRVSTPVGMGKVINLNVLAQTVTLFLEEQEERVVVPAAEIGMAVRVEEQPNEALASELRADRAIAAAEVSTTKPPTTSEPPRDRTADAKGEAAARRPHRRRRRTQGGGGQGGPAAQDARETTAPQGAQETSARAADTGSGAPASEGSEGGPARPRRRRRRSRRGGGGGQSSGQASGRGSGPATGGDG